MYLSLYIVSDWSDSSLPLTDELEMKNTKSQRDRQWFLAPSFLYIATCG